jgi:branched-chain amino acid transport system ATP-binding protein
MSSTQAVDLLAIKGVHLDFSGLQVLKGVDLQIEKGQRHALIGPNGAGKTTLFHIITGNLRPSQGQIFYDSQDITDLSVYGRNRLGIGRSFQITNVFPNLTVFDNVLAGVQARYGLRYNLFRNPRKQTEIMEKTEAILEWISLAHARDQFARELPYGEQRALEIGLCLSTEPQLILLDEPTAGMSREDTRKFISMIDELTRNLTLLIIEHDMDVVFSLASKISVLHYGTILVSGRPDEVQNDQRVKDAYLGEDE